MMIMMMEEEKQVKKKKKMSLSMAVRVIQIAWRRTLAPCTTRKLAEEFNRVLSINSVMQEIRFCMIEFYM